MNEALNNKNYDRFEDYFDYCKFGKEGIVELKRKYVKNGLYIKDDVTGLIINPISAYGITAFLSGRDGASFRQSLPPHRGNNTRLVSVQMFYDQYLNGCMKFLRIEEKLSTSFEDDWKSEKELTAIHLVNEERLFNESKLIFDEIDDVEMQTIETIKKAALRYPEWVKKTYLNSNTDSLVEEFENYLINVKRKKQFIEQLKENFPVGKNKDAAIMVFALSECGLICPPKNQSDLRRTIGKEWNIVVDVRDESFDRELRNFKRTKTDKEKDCSVEYDGDINAAITKINQFDCN